MKLFVEIREVYGETKCYPACEKSKLFAELIGTKTLTDRAMKTITALGYQIFESPASANKRRDLMKFVQREAA